MRSFYVEHTAFDYGDIPPSRSFFACLTKSITPQIVDCIDNIEIKNDITKIICLTIDPESYLHPQIDGNICKMKMYISSHHALMICSIYVFWRSLEEKLIFPWDDNISKTEISFWMDFPLISKLKMNWILPELYHPVVKSSKSGLPYDYEIYNTTEGDLRIYPVDSFSQNDLILINKIIHTFRDKWNITNKRKISFIGDAVFSSKRIVYPVDFGSCPRETIVSLISSFSDLNSIKKIVYHYK